MRLLPFFLVSLIMFSCNKKCSEQPPGPKLNIKIERLDKQLAQLDSPQKVEALISEYPVLTDLFLNRNAYPSDSVFIASMIDFFSNKSVDSLALEIEASYGDLAPLEEQISHAFSFLKYYYPDFNPPRVYAAFSGMQRDLIVLDSAIVIGLDFYLGQNAKYRPLGYPNYISRRFEREYIVPSILIAMSDRYNVTDNTDNTLMADMVYYGKAFSFAKHMMPCAPDSLFIWYTDEEIRGVRENESTIWSHFIDNELLYTTNHVEKDRYTSERPNVVEIGNACPGRIANWVGWEIVRSYEEKNPNVSLQQLMKNADAGEIFRQSGYKPDPR